MNARDLLASSQLFVFVIGGLLGAPIERRAEAAILRVDGASGADTGGCGGVGNPCANVQQAVNLASDGDEIRVSAGTYTYQLGLDPCSADHTAVVCVFDLDVTLRGGYAAPSWDVSDPLANPTVIDGQTTHRGVLISGSSTALDQVVFEGFTVRNGLGLYNDTNVNGFGGGLSAIFADLTVRNSRFEDNVAQGQDTGSAAGGAGAGGGLAIRSNGSAVRGSLLIEDVTFDGNTARGGTGTVRGGFGQGGALWINYSDATGTDLIFVGNSALAGDSAGSGTSGGNADAQGGAVAFKEASVSTFERIEVRQNMALGGAADPAAGKAGGSFGGGVYGERATLTLRDALIEQNTSTGGNADSGGGGFGGGVMSLDCDTTLDRVAIIANEARGGDGPTKKGSGGGGAGYFSDTEGSAGGRLVSVVNSMLADNEVYLGVGGGSTAGGGGAVFLNGAQAAMTHCTVAQNFLQMSPLQGTAMVIITRTPSTTPIASNMDFDFGVISDHVLSPGDGAVHVKPDSSITFDTGIFANNGVDTAGTGTFNGLGTMASESSVDYVSPGSPDYDYHLMASSPAIGAAIGSSTPLDFDGASRDVSPDLGADEYGASLDLIFRDGFESGDTSAWP